MEDFEFSGFDELATSMEGLSEEISGQGMERMVRAGAAVFKRAMVERAPVLDKKTTGSDSLDPGAMRDGIRVYVPKGETPVEAHIGPRKALQRVAVDVEYGHRSVHGGRLTLLGNGKTSGKGVAGEDVPAHPFIRPAYEAAFSAAEDAMIESMNQTVGNRGGSDAE